MPAHADFDQVFGAASGGGAARLHQLRHILGVKQRVAVLEPGPDRGADIIAELPVVIDRLTVGPDHEGNLRQRLEHRAEPFLALAQRRFGAFAVVDVAKHDNETSLRSGLGIEADPAPAKRRRDRFPTAARWRVVEHRAVGAIGFAVLDPGEDIEEPPADHRVGGLVPQFERATVGEKDPFVAVHRVDRVADRLQDLGKGLLRRIAFGRGHSHPH